MSKVLIVDDSDPAIVYSSSWTAGANVAQSTNEYNGTVHQSNTSGDQLSYTFYGTRISIYGTLDSPSLHGPPNATFAVDATTPVKFNTSTVVIVDNPTTVTSHTLLYQSPGLPRETHTLSIKTGTPSNPAARLYIDFFTVSTGSDSASGNIIVDDRDVSVAYTGTWSDAGASSEYLHTTRQSPDTANGGSAELRFNGTRITVYGTTPTTLGPETVASIDFLIDGVHNSTFTGPQRAGILKHTTLFHPEGLSNNCEHSVTMNTLASNWWYLDYMVYTTQNSAIAGGGGGQDTGGGTSPSVGPIVGGVIAGVLVLVGLLALAFIFIRRRRTQRDLANPRPATGFVAGPAITPFNSGYTYNYGPTPPNPPVPTGSSIPFQSNSGGGSSAYTGYSNGQPVGITYTEPFLYIPRHVSAAQGISYGSHPHNNPLYPQFDAGGLQRVTSDAHSTPSHEHHNTRGPTILQSRNEKSRFVTAQNRSTSSQATVASRPGSPSPSSAIVEQDSGIRIPAIIPPVYTVD